MFFSETATEFGILGLLLWNAIETRLNRAEMKLLKEECIKLYKYLRKKGDEVL